MECKADSKDAPRREPQREQRDERSVCQCGQAKYSDANTCGHCHDSQQNWGTR